MMKCTAGGVGAGAAAENGGDKNLSGVFWREYKNSLLPDDIRKAVFG